MSDWEERRVCFKNAELDDMPPEVLESIYKLTDSNSSVALMLTSKGFLEKLGNSKQFWKHVASFCNLNNAEWKETNFEDTPVSWKSLYIKFKKIQTKFISEQTSVETSRIYLDLRNRIQTSPSLRDSVVWHKIEHFGSEISEQKKVARTFKHCSKAAVSQNIFGIVFSDKYMVVYVSKLGNSSSTKLYVWNVEDDISFSYSIEDHELCQYQIRNYETLVWGHFLIVMARDPKIINGKCVSVQKDVPLIKVYDLRNPSLNIAAVFYLKESVSPVKFLVEIDGERGHKLSVWDNKLLVVSPENNEGKRIMSFYLLDLVPLMSVGMEEGQLVLKQLWYSSLDNVAIECPFSFFANDQKGPAFVLAINQALSNQLLGQQFVYINLDVEGEVVLKVFDGGDIQNALPDVGIPIFGTYQDFPSTDFELNPNITNIRLECLIATSDTFSKLAILTTDGTIVTYQPSKGFTSFRPIAENYVDIDTYSDELHIYQDKIIVMKIFQNRGKEKNRLTFLTTFNGELLWKVDHSTVLNPNQRFFLNPMFNFIFVSSADEVAVYNVNNGNLVTKLQYPKIKKQPLSSNEDIYSQSGYSVWDIRRVGDRIVVTHDIERANPVIADWINIF